jgi:hypothetical protein
MNYEIASQDIVQEAAWLKDRDNKDRWGQAYQLVIDQRSGKDQVGPAPKTDKLFPKATPIRVTARHGILQPSDPRIEAEPGSLRVEDMTLH